MCRLSVIIPVYNAEVYLKRCVDSVLKQSLQDFQLVLVDDGSQDKSPEICDAYEAMDCRIKVIHQQNAGVSAARNSGIKAATGKYIGFVDSDDWIDPKMFKRLICEAERTGADVVMCDATTVYDDGRTQADTITQLSENLVLKKTDFSPSLLLEMAGSAWRCIYKHDRYSDKLRKYPLAFPLGVKFSEDRIFNLYAFGQANKVSYIKESYYYRYVNLKSAVHRFHEDYFEAYKKAADSISEAIKLAWDNDQNLQTAYLGQFITGAFGAICNYFYKTSPLCRKEKMKKVQAVCDDEQLKNAIQVYGADGKSKWVMDKNYLMLIAYAKLANIKHGR